MRNPLVDEANIVFGVHAHATSLITIAKLRKHFSKSETSAVAHKVCRKHGRIFQISPVVTLDQ